MSNIPVACATSNHHPVIATLFTLGSDSVIGDAIYHVTSSGAKAQGSYYGGGYISPATLFGTAFTLPNLYRAAAINSTTVPGGNSYSPRYIPPGF